MHLKISFLAIFRHNDNFEKNVSNEGDSSQNSLQIDIQNVYVAQIVRPYPVFKDYGYSIISTFFVFP